MKYLLLTLIIVALLWIVSIAWANRRKPHCDNRDSSGSGGDSCGGFLASDCNSSDGGCSGGDGGGGGD